MAADLAFRVPVSRIVRPGSARARAWNKTVQAVVRRDSRGRLPFFCECGMESCRDSVWLTLREVRDAIEGGELLIGAHFFQELEARAAVSQRGGRLGAAEAAPELTPSEYAAAVDGGSSSL